MSGDHGTRRTSGRSGTARNHGKRSARAKGRDRASSACLDRDAPQSALIISGSDLFPTWKSRIFVTPPATPFLAVIFTFTVS